MKAKSIRAIAFYLPQYHPIPENDAWWGKGFTEWTNVVKAAPAFKGHYQPHLPADLGFYDLRLSEAREAQAALAREYGIHGFCCYHYWFKGRRLLNRPMDEVLASGKPDFPFCFCWANENWTRRWDGCESEILLRQEYSAEDDIAHFQALLPAFSDPRYIRVDGRPLFLVYRATRLPDPAATVSRWRMEAARGGLPGVYLCCVESFQDEHGIAAQAGFDAAVEFAPDWSCSLPAMRRTMLRRLARRLRLGTDAGLRHAIFDYRALATAMLAKPRPNYLRYPCVVASWDNHPRRREGATIYHGSTPTVYEQWLTEAIRAFSPPSPTENLVFLNAWNEWGEGSHLEPCQKWGRAYLEKTRRALEVTGSLGSQGTLSPCADDR